MMFCFNFLRFITSLFLIILLQHFQLHVTHIQLLKMLKQVFHAIVGE